jgi:hypothetical protein
MSTKGTIMVENTTNGATPRSTQKGPPQDAYEQLVETVNNAPLEVKQDILQKAVESAASYGNAEELVRHTVGAAPVEAKKAAVEGAVETSRNGEKKQIIEKGLQQASAKTQAELAQKYGPSQQTLDQIWLLIVRTFAWVLSGATVGLIVIIVLAGFRDVDLAHIQIMLTVFTTVAGILAGFITGQALGGSGAQRRDEGKQ